MEKLEALYIAGGNVKGCSCCGKQSVFKRLNTELLYDPVIPLLSTPTREMRALCPHRNLCMNVHSSIIHNSPKMET